MQSNITPFLMFAGKAEEALNFYVSLFRNSSVTDIQRYGAAQTGAEGSVLRATFTLGGQEFICIDSPVKHDFSFTPSLSLFVNCPSEEEIDKYFEELSRGGQILMPLDVYPFSRKFAWITDRFGVSWQLNLD